MHEGYQANKTEVVKWFYKINWIAWIAVIVSVGSLSLSFYTYKKFLPLQSANLFIPWSETIIYPNSGYDVIEPTLKNVGGADAEKIRLRIYAMPLNNNYDFGWSKKLYDEIMPGKLPPKESVPLKLVAIPQIFNMGNEKIDLRKLNEPIALMFYLNYEDTLTGEKNTFSAYLYTMGVYKLNFLSGNDYQKIKQPLIKFLESESDKNTDLIDFIEKLYL